MTAVEHADGIISVYARARGATAAPPLVVEADTALADAGVSGWSGTAGFYLLVFDRNERRWVNPAILLPSAAKAGPPIRAVMLRDEDGLLIDLAAVRTVRRGRYSVLVRRTGASENADGKAAAFRRIVCSVSGIEAGSLNIETFSAADGTMTVFRDAVMPVSRVYAFPPYLEAAEVVFGRGMATLEVTAEAASTQRAGYRLFIE
jgi:hypothetical protein